MGEIETKEVEAEDQFPGARPIDVKAGQPKRNMPAIILAALATLFGLVSVTMSSGDGIGIGVNIISSLTMGAGAMFTIYSVLWDILFLLGPVILLICLCTGSKNTKKAFIAALTMNLVLIVLEIAFGIYVHALGTGVFRSFSLLEFLIIAAQSGDANLVVQILVYGGAFATFIVATKSKKDKVKIVTIGFAIVTAIGLVSMIAGMQPFAYTIGGYSILGYSVPKVGSYFISELLSCALMWAAITVSLAKDSKASEEEPTNAREAEVSVDEE